MGDSDDEYDRKRRDKFRGERAEASYRGAERVSRPRDDWNERDSWSRPRPREYRSAVRDRGYSPSLEPAPKRLRHDFYGDNYYSHYVPYHQASHREPTSSATQSEGQQPPMMSFKAFLVTQDDNISDKEAIEKYNDYKLEFQRQQLNEFFVAHKDDEWFRLKYHPEDSVKRKQEQIAALKKRVGVFLDLLNGGKVQMVSVDCSKTNDLLKLLDTVVIKLENGTDEDLRLLEQEYAEMEEKLFEKPKDDNCIKIIDNNNEKKENEKVSSVIDDNKETDKVNNEQHNESMEDGEIESTNKVENQNEIINENKKDDDDNKRDNNENDDNKVEDKNDKKGEDEKMEIDNENKKNNEEKEEEGGEKEIDKKENNEEGEEQNKLKSDNEVNNEEENEEQKKSTEDNKEKKKEHGYSGSSSSSSSSGGESDEEKESKEKTEQVKSNNNNNNNNEEQTVETKEDEVDDDKEKITTIPDDKPEKPQSLHKTTSIFLRNLSPTITKQEVEAVCSRYEGFLRVALADPQPERRWLRRGWVTFKREANIKEICWNLNNIRLRDCELGAIVNRDLSRRIRPINGITAHKQVIRSDIRIAAKVTLHLDNKAGLWLDENDEKKMNNKQEQLSFGLMSNNPILHNITDYLIEEASAEEEELLGLESSTDNQDTAGVVERDDQLVSVLDRIVLYLRIVHSVDYYNHCEYPNEDEMPNRCGILHARGPPPTAKTDMTQFIGAPIETKMANFLPEKPQDENKNETKLLNLSLKDVNTEIDKFVQANTRELAKDKWLCPLSGKKFKGPDFVRKHIFNKHGEKIEEVKKEVEFFNNYLKDHKRPMLSETPQPKREEPPTYNHPSYGNSFGGYGRPPSYYNQGFPQRSRGYTPRTRGVPGDYRPVIHYRDLDAPREPEEFI